MQNTPVNEGQTLLDVAMQHCGDAEIAFEIAALNGLDIDELVLGSSILMPEVIIDKVAVVKAINIIPASNITSNINFEDEWTLYYTKGLPTTHA